MRAQAITRMLFGSAMLFLFTAPAYSAPVFYSWGGEKIIKIMDFPDSSDLQRLDGNYVDAGYRYQQVTIFFIPVWNYNEKWCGYIGNDNEYLDLDRQSLSELAEAAGLSLPESPSLPFWDSIGGKLLLGVILLMYFGYKGSGAEKKGEEIGQPQGGSMKA